jgi:hypothetical protein
MAQFLWKNTLPVRPRKILKVKITSNVFEISYEEGMKDEGRLQKQHH